MCYMQLAEHTLRQKPLKESKELSGTTSEHQNNNFIKVKRYSTRETTAIDGGAQEKSSVKMERYFLLDMEVN